MRRLFVLIGLIAALGVVGVGGYVVAQDTPATPEVVHPGTPDILPEFCATPQGIATPVMIAATPDSGQATPALFPCGTPEGSPAAGAAAPVTIEAVDIAWNPNAATIPANVDVTVRVPNVGSLPHTFVIEALGIKVEMAPGETKEVIVNAPAGTYAFICDVPGHEAAGMVGTLTVQ